MPSKIARPAKQAAKPRSTLGLVFAENQNDADALAMLAMAIWPEAPKFKYLRKPLVLVRNVQEAEARKKNASDIMRTVAAMSILHEIRLVVAHRDCDALEPAHLKESAAIEDELTRAGVPNVVAATPAWEIEAWWFLWPEAVASVNAKWRRLNRRGNHGSIRNAKEELRRSLRDSNKPSRDYEESDSIRIARFVQENGLVDKLTGTCGSYHQFRSRLQAVAGF